MPGITVPAWLLLASWFVDFIALLPVGMFLVGVGKRPEPIWTTLFIGGVFHFALGAAAIAYGDIFLASALFVFAWIFMGIGWMSYREHEPTGIGSFVLGTAILFVVYAIYCFYHGLIDWGIIMLTIVGVLAIVCGMDYGKIPAKVCGTALIIFALWALVVGSAMMFGHLVY